MQPVIHQRPLLPLHFESAAAVQLEPAGRGESQALRWALSFAFVAASAALWWP